jgi:hypothetical protein
MAQLEAARGGGNGSGTALPHSDGDGVGLQDIGDDIGAQAEAQKARAADRVDRAADAVRSAADGMRGQEAWVAGLVERGADELARMADALRTSDFRSLLNQAESFARRQPVLFAGAGAVLGFALTRAARAGLAAASAPASNADAPADRARQAAFDRDTSGRNGGSREH